MNAYHASQLAQPQLQELRGQDHTDDEPCETTSSFAGESARRMPLYITGLTVAAGALVGLVLWTAQTAITLVPNRTYRLAGNDEESSWNAEKAWNASMVSLGASLICFLSKFLIKMIGREWAILSMVVPQLIGWLFINFANDAMLLMIGRFLLGVAGGAFCLVAPTFIAQIAQSSMRGTLGTLRELLVLFGTLFVFGVSVAMNMLVMTIICGPVPLAFGLLFYMPTRINYSIKERLEKAHERAEIAGLGVVENAKIFENVITFFHDLKNRATIRVLIISMGLMFFQQLSGIDAVIFHATEIFPDASTKQGAIASTIIIGAIQIVALFLTTAIANNANRRILLMISAIFMAISTTILAVYFMRKENDAALVKNLDWLAFLAVCLFIAMFSIGFGPIPLLMVAELCTSNVYACVSQLTGGFNYLSALLVTEFFTYLRQALGTSTEFWLFSTLSLLGTVFVFFVVPETKGVTPEEIQRMLSGEEMPRSSIQSNPSMEDDEEPLV